MKKIVLILQLLSVTTIFSQNLCLKENVYGGLLNPFAPTVGDFNEDGIPDLAMAGNQNGYEITILLGKGNGSFKIEGVYSLNLNGTNNIAVGHFKGDKHLDILASCLWGKSFLSGNGDGTFKIVQDTSNFFRIPANSVRLLAGNFNSDSYLDIAFTNGGSSSIGVCTGSNSVIFNTPTYYATGLSTVIYLEKGYFNADSILDLAAVGIDDNKISVLIGNGDGTFKPGVEYPVGIFPVSCTVGDFNNDGKADIASANQHSPGISILLGNGDGTFQTAVNMPTSFPPRFVEAADLNLDGNADLIVSGLLGGFTGLNVYLGNGNGSFQQANPEFQVNLAGAEEVTIADLNNDLRKDIILGSYDTGYAVFMNNIPPTINFGTALKTCKDSPISLSTSGAISYRWWSKNSGPDTLNGVNFIVSPDTTGYYQTLITYYPGCTLSDSVKITAFPLPTVNISPGVNICKGDSAQLLANGGLSYSWNPSGTLNNSEIPNPMAYPITSSTYTVTVTDLNSCTNTQSVTITVVPLDINTSGTVYMFCGDSVTLSTSTSYDGILPMTFKWSPSFAINYNTLESPTVAPSSNQMYYVSANNTCGQVVTDSVYVTLSGPLSSPFICLVTVDTVSGKNMLIWDKFPGQKIEKFRIYKETTVAGVYDTIGSQRFEAYSTFIDTSSRPLQEAARYKLSELDSCGNESPLSPDHKTIHLNINKGLGNTWNLIWDAYEGFSFKTYLIFRGTTAADITYLTSIQSSLFSYTDVTAPVGDVFYVVAVLDSVGCSPSMKTKPDFHTLNTINMSISNFASNTLLSVQNLTEKNSWEVIPNPSSGNLVINTGKGRFGMAILSVINITGKEILKKEIDLSLSNISVDLSSVDKGVYFLRILDEKSNTDFGVKKIIISGDK